MKFPPALNICTRCAGVTVQNGSFGCSDTTAASYQVITTGNANHFSATGLPAGLSIDSGTGIISGTTTALTGVYTSVVSADNGYRNAIGVITITVTELTHWVFTKSSIPSGAIDTAQVSIDGGAYATMQTGGFIYTPLTEIKWKYILAPGTYSSGVITEVVTTCTADRTYTLDSRSTATIVGNITVSSGGLGVENVSSGKGIASTGRTGAINLSGDFSGLTLGSVFVQSAGNGVSTIITSLALETIIELSGL